MECFRPVEFGSCDSLDIMGSTCGFKLDTNINLQGYIYTYHVPNKYSSEAGKVGCVCQVGTPEQKFSVVFDTGSGPEQKRAGGGRE